MLLQRSSGILLWAIPRIAAACRAAGAASRCNVPQGLRALLPVPHHAMQPQGLLALPPVPPPDAMPPATPAKVAGRTVAEMSAEMTTAMAKRTDENALRKRPAAAAQADQDEERHMFK